MSRHLTPTAYAEEAYEAAQNRRADRAMKKGPAGIPIPPRRQVYRKTVDGKLLMQIRTLAFASWRSSILTHDRFGEVAASLRADLLRRFPVEDMKVLVRYGKAQGRERVTVEILAGDYEPSQTVGLPAITLTPDLPLFHVDLGGRGASTGAPVPSDTVPFFRDIVRVRREQKRSFEPALHWTGVFFVENKRWPRWEDIEDQFPLIGEWMEGQRNA